MTESETPQAWYQNGWIMLVLLAVFIRFVFPAYQKHQEDQKLVAIPLITGQVEQQFLGNPVLKIKIWHQFPGILRNGILTLDMQSDLLTSSQGEQIEIYSFEQWSPNQENGVEFSFPMHTFDPNKEIPVEVILRARNAKSYQFTSIWIGNTWKSNLE